VLVGSSAVMMRWRLSATCWFICTHPGLATRLGGADDLQVCRCCSQAPQTGDVVKTSSLSSWASQVAAIRCVVT
jgi:hypothetical protein